MMRRIITGMICLAALVVSTAPTTLHAETVTSVRTLVVKKAVFSRELTVVGTTMAKDIIISPKVMGKIERIHVIEGNTVARGQLLISLEDNDYQLGYTTARIGLNQAKVALESVEKDYRRMKDLYESRTIPEQQFDKIDEGYRQAKIGVEMAGANLERAKNQLDYTKIHAPVAGIVTMKMADEGSIVAPGVPILKMQSVGGVYAMLNVPENELPNIRLRDSVDLSIDSVGSTAIRGRVSSIVRSVDPMTRTFRVRVDIVSRGVRVYAGSYVKGSIYLRGNSSLSIPRYAVGFDERGGKYVFVVSNGRAYKRSIVTGGRRGDLLEVLSGLKENEEVVVSGTEKLFDRSAVRIIK